MAPLARRLRPVAFLTALALLLPGTAAAAESLRCRGEAAYGGRPQRPALRLPSLPAVAHPGPAADAAARLEAAFRTSVERTGAATIAAAVRSDDGTLWSAAHGLAGERRFHFWASAGKTFVAVAVLQLVEEGRLSLDDPVSRWLDDIPNGDLVTIRHLLEHRSGLFSVNEDEAWRASPSAHDLAQVMAVIRRRGPLFCPGSAWGYSNSDYVLLGAIVERIEQRAFASVLEDRVVRRAGLTDIQILTAEGDLGRVAPPAPASGRFDPRWPGAAGPVAATPEAMIGFWHALLSGRLLQPQTVEAMFASLYPMFGSQDYYGLGVSVIDVPMGDGTADIWLGHLGGTLGSNAIVAYSTRRRAFVAVALTGEGPAPAAANLLVRALDAE